jgi:hypothetical protein
MVLIQDLIWFLTDKLYWMGFQPLCKNYFPTPLFIGSLEQNRYLNHQNFGLQIIPDRQS